MSETHSKYFKTCVITVSDSRSTGEREDTVGPKLKERLVREGFDVFKTLIVPDDRIELAQAIKNLADKDGAEIIITTGGTGVSPRDVTPEATLDVITREIPGLAECMRYSGASKTPFSWISRAVVGIRNSCLVINVPGSERGAIESIEAILPMIPHTVETIQGKTSECGKKVGDDK